MHLRGVIDKFSSYLAVLSYFWSLFFPVLAFLIPGPETEVMEHLHYYDRFLNGQHFLEPILHACLTFS